MRLKGLINIIKIELSVLAVFCRNIPTNIFQKCDGYVGYFTAGEVNKRHLYYGGEKLASNSATVIYR
ncbi:Uncharacterised protein [Yersinia pekkanenii]|uniref:Uncharacterized protein n=1 Tax=Yersinia pekkanenii TaxID=1288385 RepID=A0ABM9TUF3_9GAMM|nr:Uncharacterised protein [Yersinia pekkanenii]